MIDPLLAQVGEHTFLLLTPLGIDLMPLAEPEIAKVIWASSVGAVKRVVRRDIESDDSTIASPPKEFTFGIEPTYHGLLTKSQELFPSGVMESAAYRIATDGKFICREILTPNSSFHFRSNKGKMSEIPFVIQHQIARG